MEADLLESSYATFPDFWKRTYHPIIGNIYGVCLWYLLLCVLLLCAVLRDSHISTVFLTNMAPIFEGTYHEKTGISGLHYLAFGFGFTIVSQINARYMDHIYVYFKNKNNGVGEPEFRLRELLLPPRFALFFDTD